MNNIAKIFYDRQEEICYLFNRYFAVTDLKVNMVWKGTEVVSIENLMSEIAKAYKQFDGKQIYVIEIPLSGINIPRFDYHDGNQKITLSVDVYGEEISVKEVTEHYLLSIANYTSIKEPELEFVMNFIKDHREA